MKTVELVGTVTVERTVHLTVQLPFDVSPGEYRIIVAIDQNTPAGNQAQTPLDFPVDNYGPWPAKLSLNRQGLYNEAGR